MTFEKIQKMIAAQRNIAPASITVSTELVKDLKADSLDVVEMIMSLEEEFGVTIPEDKVAGLKTVGDIVKFIDSVKK